MMRKESDIQRAILDYLKARGIMAWRQKSEGTYDAKRGIYRRGTGTPGLPDIGGILPGGRALQIEVKAGRNNVTPEQVNFLVHARIAGAVAFVAWSVDDVIRELMVRELVVQELAIRELEGKP
jgi:Holliday junction resolvase